MVATRRKPSTATDDDVPLTAAAQKAADKLKIDAKGALVGEKIVKPAGETFYWRGQGYLKTDETPPEWMEGDKYKGKRKRESSIKAEEGDEEDGERVVKKAKIDEGGGEVRDRSKQLTPGQLRKRSFGMAARKTAPGRNERTKSVGSAKNRRLSTPSSVVEVKDAGSRKRARAGEESEDEEDQSIAVNKKRDEAIEDTEDSGDEQISVPTKKRAPPSKAKSTKPADRTTTTSTKRARPTTNQDESNDAPPPAKKRRTFTADYLRLGLEDKPSKKRTTMTKRKPAPEKKQDDADEKPFSYYADFTRSGGHETESCIQAARRRAEAMGYQTTPLPEETFPSEVESEAAGQMAPGKGREEVRKEVGELVKKITARNARAGVLGREYARVKVGRALEEKLGAVAKAKKGAVGGEEGKGGEDVLVAGLEAGPARPQLSEEGGEEGLLAADLEKDSVRPQPSEGAHEEVSQAAVLEKGSVGPQLSQRALEEALLAAGSKEDSVRPHCPSNLPPQTSPAFASTPPTTHHTTTSPANLDTTHTTLLTTLSPAARSSPANPAPAAFSTPPTSSEKGNSRSASPSLSLSPDGKVKIITDRERERHDSATAPPSSPPLPTQQNTSSTPPPLSSTPRLMLDEKNKAGNPLRWSLPAAVDGKKSEGRAERNIWMGRLEGESHGARRRRVARERKVVEGWGVDLNIASPQAVYRKTASQEHLAVVFIGAAVHADVHALLNIGIDVRKDTDNIILPVDVQLPAEEPGSRKLVCSRKSLVDEKANGFHNNRNDAFATARVLQALTKRHISQRPVLDVLPLCFDTERKKPRAGQKYKNKTVPKVGMASFDGTAFETQRKQQGGRFRESRTSTLRRALAIYAPGPSEEAR
ncbi:uncharacterized protein LTR77_001992 [Saxophila tyrrhenica]|uniref:Uncharacterized protein n=1 Tax=Saxophila tyrrhenica TaxID=1690608 RepID=A0AAV9PM59_9PEZI|nr:hypothetical protein LTR77_001992 [Saxophila tyrrhenica]